MANKQTRRPQARKDLLDIWLYIARDSEAAATALLDRISDVLGMLADNPLAGRARDELAQNLRSFPVGNYIVFYMPVANGIDVVRVLHGRLDIGPDDVE